MRDTPELERRLGVFFRDREVLRQALTHGSYLNENPDFPLGSNQRLEFLGDAVIGLVVAEELFRRCPECPEGRLTELRAILIRRQTLAQIGKDLGLGQYLYLGRGEEVAGGWERESNVSAAVEALVGAVFLDQGWEAARAVTLRLLALALEQALQQGEARDVKSQLQEVSQAHALGLPQYRLVAIGGSERVREFAVEVVVGGRVLGRGRGHQKAMAEQQAAAQALEALARKAT